MHERIIAFPYYFSGTTVGGATGTAEFPTPYPIMFKSLSVFPLAGGGATVTASYVGTAQGTATANSNSASAGSIYSGTAATGAGTTLRIPGNGTLLIQATSVTATQVSGIAYFTVDEFGGTAYPAGA
jgi:hypothetical protein